METIKELYEASNEAERLWSDELQRVYGKEACNARYDARGTNSPTLAKLADDKSATYEAFACAAFPHRARG